MDLKARFFGGALDGLEKDLADWPDIPVVIDGEAVHFFNVTAYSLAEVNFETKEALYVPINFTDSDSSELDELNKGGNG